MGERVVLDAFAVLALLGDEPGAADVAALLESKTSIFMSAVNVGEVIYIVTRVQGQEAAREVEDALYEHPRIEVLAATRDRIRAAAHVKARGGVSLADAFAAALALELDADLVTGDPEFRTLSDAGLRIRWLPVNRRGR